MPSEMLFDPWSGRWRRLVDADEFQPSFIRPDRRTIETVVLHQAMLLRVKSPS
jgi:hypothetical protein